MSTEFSCLRLALAGFVLLSGCLYPARTGGSGFAELPVAEQGMFRRCKQPLVQHLCAGADDAAQARCLGAQEVTYARRSGKMRRRWLEQNQCPSSVIDGPGEATAAAEPKAEPTVEKIDAPTSAAAPVVPAAPPALPDGAACQRSAACASDLCVRGTCVALAMIEIGRPVQSGPPPAIAAAAPAPNSAKGIDEPDEPLSRTVAAAPAPAQPAKKADEPPAAARERLPVGPRMASGDSAADQLRGAIVQHEAEMKRCVERQLKLFPDLRAEGTLVLEISATGRVTQAALHGERLQGTQLETCMRTIAARWVFPRTARAYAVEAPLKVSGVQDRRP